MTNELRNKNLSLKKRLEIIERMNLKKGMAIEMIINLSDNITNMDHDERRIGYFDRIEKYRNKPSWRRSYFYCLEYSNGIYSNGEFDYSGRDKENIENIVSIKRLNSK